MMDKIINSVNGIYGEITFGLYSAWSARVKDDKKLLENHIQELFNDIHIYPSKSQVFEMLHCCIRERSSSSNTENNFLTFGEFCIFATELKKVYEREGMQLQQVSKNQVKVEERKKRAELRHSKSGSGSYDVFLGGSCNPTTWRRDLAIPQLKKLGITFYNPQQGNWVPEMIELEHQAKQNSTLLFFVIDPRTRNVVSMLEVAYFSGNNRKLILVMNPYSEAGQEIQGEPITKNEFQDLVAGQTILHDLVEKQGIPVFDDISVALNCAAKVLKENLPIEDLGLKDNAQPVRMAHVQIGDKLIRLREAFDALDNTRSAKISLADARMAFRIHAHRDLSQSDLKQILSAHGISNASINTQTLQNIMIDFNDFCCIVSEFKNCDREQQKLWDSFTNKTSCVFRTIVMPFTKIFQWINSSIGNNSLHGRVGAPARRGSSIRDVYLGGSNGSSAWRQRLAIPMLRKSGLTFFNAQGNNIGSKRLIPIEAAAMDNSRILLFVILGSSRSLWAMCEAAYYVGLGCNLVICIENIPDNAIINSEKLSKTAIKDYNRGRSYLSDIANREGVPVFEDINEALDCVIQKCKNLR